VRFYVAQKAAQKAAQKGVRKRATQKHQQNNTILYFRDAQKLFGGVLFFFGRPKKRQIVCFWASNGGTPKNPKSFWASNGGTPKKFSGV
jgi:hypothetical protein